MHVCVCVWGAGWRDERVDRWVGGRACAHVSCVVCMYKRVSKTFYHVFYSQSIYTKYTETYKFLQEKYNNYNKFNMLLYPVNPGNYLFKNLKWQYISRSTLFYRSYNFFNNRRLFFIFKRVFVKKSRLKVLRRCL